LEEVLAGLKKRDQIDSSREIAPLKPAEDAIILNTDGLSIEEVLKRAFELCGVVENG
jgi:cytidylate kinase